MAEHTIGIDISKAHLDAFHLEDAIPRRFENSPRGLRALARWLETVPLARIVFEATGPYHRAFEMALSGRFPLVKVNPLQARRFAEACGARAKPMRSTPSPWRAWGQHLTWRRTSRPRRRCAISGICKLHARV